MTKYNLNIFWLTVPVYELFWNGPRSYYEVRLGCVRLEAEALCELRNITFPYLHYPADRIKRTKSIIDK